MRCGEGGVVLSSRPALTPTLSRGTGRGRRRAGAWAVVAGAGVFCIFGGPDELDLVDYPGGVVRGVHDPRADGGADDAGFALQGGREAGDAVAGAVRAVGVYAGGG